MERFDEAVVSYRRSLEIDADDIGSLNNLGQVYNELDQFDDAIAVLIRGLALAGTDRHLEVNLADALYKSGRKEEGRAAMRKAAEHHPSNAWVQGQLGYQALEDDLFH